MENEGFSFLSRLQKQLKRAQRTPNTANILREPRLRNELLQTNQAALNQRALSFFKSRREATVSAAHTWEDTWYQRWEKAMSKDPAVFFFFFFLFFIFLDFSVSLLCAGRESKPWNENYTSEGWWMLQDGSRTSPSTPKEDIHFSFSWWLTLLITERRQGGCIKLMNTCGWNEIGLITPPYCLRCLWQTEKKMGRSVWKRKEERKRKTGNEIQK